MSLGVAIVGCGLIGRKRAAALTRGRVVVCADVDIVRARQLAAACPDAQAIDSWEQAVSRSDVDVVIVATTNDALAAVARGALDAGKHVLVEKPAGRSAAEVTVLREAAARADRRVRVGFNHRYHPAMRKARELVDSGAVGELMFLRARYGHGGRLGYEQEGRAQPAISGGGELIDQGVHVIDLARWFLGNFTSVEGVATNYFWKMPVDDNAFMTMPPGRASDCEVARA